MNKTIIKFEHKEGKKYNLGSDKCTYMIQVENKYYHYYLIDSGTGEMTPIKSYMDLDNLIRFEGCKVIDGDASINKI